MYMKRYKLWVNFKILLKGESQWKKELYLFSQIERQNLW